ncbi:putative protein kinase [Leptomonas seymouri]|uniref:non-specific serine/threonine protein kinase n=1 Tax=Leptomonas seymouri TaxID=5684 RepID=A0A0N1PFF2_LEPSE|nr:putative protein kinase [Leptomonas seymouri]|eukprot:KPI90175.1 putative protein kinase [Leptomonas seymouri]
MEEYTIKRKIGDGAQGVVYEVEHNTSKVAYAMKVICCADQEQVNLALKEIKVLLQLRHPSIVSYVDFFLIFNSAKLRHEFAVQRERGDTPVQKGRHDVSQRKKDDSLKVCSLSNSEVNLGSLEGRKADGEGVHGDGFVPTALLSQGGQGAAAAAHWLGKEEIAVCLVMELCRNGDMQGLVRESRQQWMETGTHPITEAQVLSWLEQGAAALQFIHEKGFLHRDLKPTNIFFDEYKDIKIGDFGLAATVGMGRNSAVGTPYYLAPERMLQQRYDDKVDVWGLGVVLLELLTLRERPINSMVLENPKAADDVVQQITTMNFSSKLAELVRSMLQRQPQDRPDPLAILQRLAAISTPSAHLGMSATLFAGMSCPKIPDALCDVCEVETASVMCTSCKAAFCTGCDRARHKHHSRQSHERSSLSSLANGLGAGASTPSSTTAPQQQQQQQLTLSFSRGPSTGNNSDQTRSNMQNASLFPSGSISRTLPRDREMNSRTFNRFLQLAMPGNSMSMSDFSVTQSMMARRESSGNQQHNGGNGVTDTVLHVPQDVATLAQALQMVESMPHIRKIVVASSTTHTSPLVLTSRLPDGLRLVGESPPPMLEIADSPFALHCQSGKGTVENFVVRHVGRCRAKLRELDANHHCRNAEHAANGERGDAAAPSKKPSRPTAVSITGGDWRLHKCRISCVEGSGVTVGGGKHMLSSSSTANTNAGATLARSSRPPPFPQLGQGQTNVVKGDDEDVDGDGAERASRRPLEPMVTKCTFIDITTAGIVLMEKTRGLYEDNTFSGCGFAAFLLKKESTPRIRANHITDGAEAGIFCQDASGMIEYNVIAQNTGCGIVVKGASAAPVIRKNRVLSNAQAGVFCCDRASPFVSDNEIRRNGKAGVLVKTSATPKITKNVIEEGKEAGIYVFDKGAGIIEENRIRMNLNAGLLVTTGGNPHVIHNTLTKNAYEGVWVCKNGGGTFCDNDLRGNTKGAKDVEADCRVIWVSNLEQ